LTAGFIALAGCAAPGQRVGQSTTVGFGTVRSADEVPVESAAAQGALVGGMLGLVGGSRNRSSVGNAIQGAAIGGVAGAAAEGGNRTAMSYTVDMLDGTVTRIVTDQREIRPGDCVAVERAGNTANIRRAPDYCTAANRQAVAAVERESASAAAACENAKQEVGDATTASDADLATRKIHLLCDD
jgi:hypothetical protein